MDKMYRLLALIGAFMLSGCALPVAHTLDDAEMDTNDYPINISDNYRNEFNPADFFMDVDRRNSRTGSNNQNFMGRPLDERAYCYLNRTNLRHYYECTQRTKD